MDNLEVTTQLMKIVPKNLILENRKWMQFWMYIFIL